MFKIKTQKEEEGIKITLFLETAKIKAKTSLIRNKFFKQIDRFKCFLDAKRKKLRIIIKIIKTPSEELSIDKRYPLSIVTFSEKIKNEKEFDPQTKKINFYRVSSWMPKFSKKYLFKIISAINIAFLILQAISFNGIFLNTDNFAYAQQFCSVSVDVVLLTDVSGSMNDGQASSECRWSEKRPYGGGLAWFINKKYNISENWCLNIRDSYDTTYQNPYVPVTFTPATNAKITDAKTAAKNFLDNFKTEDQSALVSFSDTATLVKV
ncbi:MAG: hypothetical protein PHS27_01645, partial [Candidatus Pacebacteria bacterium]|nr:hypothetical protein [Candidatus Paceibacterota bacterium]